MTGTMSEILISQGVRFKRTLQLTLDNQVRSENTHGANSNTGLGGSVRGTKASEDNGRRAAHGTKEWL
jgi:hypothetical protein